MLLKLNGLSFLLTTDCIGGVFTQTLVLARDFIARGAHVIVATIGPEPRADQIIELTATGAEWAAIPSVLDWLAPNAESIARSAAAIEEFARARRVTSVHLHAPAYAAFGFSRPHIVACHSCHATWWSAVHGHELMPPELAWRAELTRIGLERAPDSIAPSHSFAANLASQYGLSQRPIAVPNGIAERECPPQKRHGALAIGRFWDEAKNFATLKSVAARVHDHLTAIGPVPDLLGDDLPDQLRVMGAVASAQVHEYLSNSLIFVSAALYEPFGLAALEAAQAGLALVLSDIPAHRENWDGVAIFRDPHDSEGFARAINQLMSSPDEAEERGLSARLRARAFSIEAMGEATALTHLNPRKGRIAA